MAIPSAAHIREITRNRHGLARLSGAQSPMRSFLLLAAATAFALQTAGPAPHPVPLHAPLQDKNFYLLSLIEQNDALKTAIRPDPVLAAMTAKRLAVA
jgi:hypothetical protein